MCVDFGFRRACCGSVVLCCVFFFFKQKTAYEMRISDWSSDVCSSDLCKPADSRPAGSRNVPDTLLRIFSGASGFVAPCDPVQHRKQFGAAKRLLHQVDGARFERQERQVARSGHHDRWKIDTLVRLGPQNRKTVLPPHPDVETDEPTIRKEAIRVGKECDSECR